jgi:MoaA/NifB/PqqE/SkfB family radical SAM enzyme
MVMTATDRGRLAVQLVELVAPTPTGQTVVVPIRHPEEVSAVAQWCHETGNSIFAVRDDAVEVYRGRLADPTSRISADRMPGHRLWLYTNFHCNLACDYCCVASSPKADPRVLDVSTVRAAVAEGVAAGVRQLYLTGGEPFLHPEIDQIVAVCVAAAPTVLLTNGMLFRGSRLRLLDAMPRDGLLLQVSVDSPTPDRHDRHRGHGSWQRAVDGVATAKRLGFRVRLAATIGFDVARDEAALAALCDRLGLSADETIVRRIARQGAATSGIVVTRATLIPEVCLTASGVYWHPVAATDPAMLVSTELFPLARAISAVRDEFVAYRRRSDLLAASFPCA